MPYLLVRHKVEDYAKWKPVYDKNGGARKAGGSKGARVFRNANNPKEIVVLTEWDDLAKARQFSQSEDLKKAMQQGGVTGAPEVLFLDQVEQTSQ
jgi:heme-degrading monooxygenase HmoA